MIVCAECRGHGVVWVCAYSSMVDGKGPGYPRDCNRKCEPVPEADRGPAISYVEFDSREQAEVVLG